MSIRNTVERLSRGVVLKKRMPASMGGRPIYVSPEGGLRYWKPSLEHIDPMLTAVVRDFVYEGDTIWDIGANLGFFALAALSKSKTGKCLAIEPDIWLCNLLHKTKNANPDLQMDILPVAVSDATGVVYLNIAERSRSTNYIAGSTGSTQTGGVRSQLLVPAVDIPFLSNHFPLPDFLKIDVEGAEHLVFKGAESLFARKRPRILVEVDSANFNFITNLLNRHRYLLYDANQYALSGLVPLLGGTENILAIPK